MQRATLQPGGQRCSRASSMVCCGLHRKGTGAYLTGGRHVWNPRLPREMGGKGEEGRRESKRLTEALSDLFFLSALFFCMDSNHCQNPPLLNLGYDNFSITPALFFI